MADFDPAFSLTGANYRYPTSTEQDNGFPCGPLDQSLFNGLFYQIQAELKSIIDAGGISHTNSSHDRTLQAINALISAATGGSPSDYVLMSEARARLPILPICQTASGIFGLTAPATGTIRLPGSVTWIHRGIYLYTTSQTDFSTSASKTYHIRWDKTSDDWDIYDLADITYNPGSLAEDDEYFDTTVDDMLIARVVTNSSNVATITELKNFASLVQSAQVVGSNWSNAGLSTATADFLWTHNWSRKPWNRAIFATNKYKPSVPGGGVEFEVMREYGGGSGGAVISTWPSTRYSTKFAYQCSYATALTLNGSFSSDLSHTVV